ncbi:MAG: PH domain-containing protein [Acidobacteriota bacterium]
MPSENRLHPTSILFSLLNSARSLILPGLIVLFAARGGNRYEVWAMILVIPATLSAILRYLTYRYRFDESELVIKTGLLFRNQRHIPYSRIHNIGSLQNPVHRLLRVADVRVETAGGQEPEAKLQVLSLQALDEMRRRVRAEKAAQGAPVPGTIGSEGAESVLQEEPTGDELVALDWRDLVAQGLVDNRGMLVVGAMLGLAWQFDLVDSAFTDVRRYLPEAAPRDLIGALSWVLRFSGLAAAFLVLVRLLSVVWSFLKYWGFRLEKVGRELRSRSGLVTQVAASLPLHRIQVLSVREKFMHRLLGRLEVSAETAGSSQEGPGGSSRQRLAPVLPNVNLATFLEEVEPGADLAAVDWRRIDPRASTRMIRRGLAVVFLLSIPAFFINPWLLGLSLLFGALVVIDARREVVRRGYALSGERIYYRSGWWTRRTSLARFSKIQSVSLVESPFDRRWGMANLEIDTAGAGASAHRLHIRFLPKATAEELQTHLAAHAARTRFRWS